ncbi:hypothetical protein [Streptomyces globisporus]|uniref:hypothetical protein n=1 Tax=Streptomyces globisporus TaxID=1908 RepID=UPI002F906A17
MESRLDQESEQLMREILNIYGQRREFSISDLSRLTPYGTSRTPQEFLSTLQSAGFVRQPNMGIAPGVAHNNPPGQRYHATDEGIERIPGGLVNGPFGNLKDGPLDAALLEALDAPRAVILHYNPRDPAASNYTRHLSPSIRTQHPEAQEHWRIWLDEAWDANRHTGYHGRKVAAPEGEAREVAMSGLLAGGADSSASDTDGEVIKQLEFTHSAAYRLSVNIRRMSVTGFQQTVDANVRVMADIIHNETGVDLSLPDPGTAISLDISARRQHFFLAHAVARQLPYSDASSLWGEVHQRALYREYYREKNLDLGNHPLPEVLNSIIRNEGPGHMHDRTPAVTETQWPGVHRALDQSFLLLPREDQTFVRAWQERHGGNPSQWSGRAWTPPAPGTVLASDRNSNARSSGITGENSLSAAANTFGALRLSGSGNRSHDSSEDPDLTTPRASGAPQSPQSGARRA